MFPAPNSIENMRHVFVDCTLRTYTRTAKSFPCKCLKLHVTICKLHSSLDFFCGFCEYGTKYRVYVGLKKLKFLQNLVEVETELKCFGLDQSTLIYICTSYGKVPCVIALLRPKYFEFLVL